MNQFLPIEEIASHPDYRHLKSIAGVTIELRYATANNFAGRDLYGALDCAWLHKDAVKALELGIAWLHVQRPDLQVLILDALRPQRVQEQLWDALADTPLQMYLADPQRGSIHSFGMALDLSLLDQSGRELDMGTPFDDLSELSHPALEARFLANGDLSAAQCENRQLLRAMMAVAGFHGISTEWWHFDCGDRHTVRAEYIRIL
jgi:D-alanyl-D-alanine dipeptidase